MYPINETHIKLPSRERIASERRHPLADVLQELGAGPQELDLVEQLRRHLVQAAQRGWPAARHPRRRRQADVHVRRLTAAWRTIFLVNYIDGLLIIILFIIYNYIL